VPLLAAGATACVGVLGDFSVSSSANDGGPGDDAATIEASSEASSEGSAPDGGGGDAGQADFSLAVATPYVGVVRGASGSVGVTLAPSGGFGGAVAIAVSGLPSGITADPLTIAAGQTSGTLTLHAPAGATLGDGPQLTLTGTSGALTHTATVGLLVQDAPGALDSTFGQQGLLSGGYLFRFLGGMTLQPDGKLLVCGTYDAGPWVAFVARFNADGSPDATFGGASADGGPSGPGSVTIPAPVSQAPAGCGAVTVLPSGDIAITGAAGDANQNTVLWVVRLKSNGTLDATFGNDGVAEVSAMAVQPPSNGASLAIDSGGNLVVAGSYGPFHNPLLARFTPSGQLDTSFGSSGVAFGSYPGANGFDGLGLASNGDILASLILSPFGAQRFTPGGVLDSTFYSSGTATLAVGSSGSGANAMTLQPDGSIVLAGSSTVSGADGSSSSAIAVVRLDSSGHADSTFGTSGATTASLGAGASAASGVALEPDGRIVVAGPIQLPSRSAFGVARFTVEGALDTSFAGGQGFVSTDFGSSYTSASAVGVMADGRIVAVGATGGRICFNAPDGGQRPCNPLSLNVARYWP